MPIKIKKYNFGAVHILKKIIYLFTTLIMLAGPSSICDEFGALKGTKGFIPIFSKKRLKYMLFYTAMSREANKIYVDDAIIDLIKNHIDVNKIVYYHDLKLYKLGTSLEETAKFWSNKTNSIGFLSSSKATILQESNIASGDKAVFFRSPQIDLDGVGFTANFDTRIMKVLSKVDIIIRMKKQEKGVKLSEKDIVKIKADFMLMEMEKDLVTLIGNVKIDDTTFNITCDRLVLDLNNDENDVQKKSANSLSPSGLSKITCLGNVKIIRKVSAEELKKNGSQKAFADKAVYLKSKEQIILTEKNPRIYRGDDMISGDKIIIWKETGRLQAFKNCLVEVVDKKSLKPKKTELTSDFIDFDYNENIGIFTGNVRVKDKAMKLNCNKMTVYMEDRKKKKDTDSSKKELIKIVCVGSVITSDPSARVNCDRMVITFKDIPQLSKNTDGAISDSREIDLIKCFGNVYMVNIPKDPKTMPTTISSDNSVLNIRGNVADLLGHVKIEESKFDLICKKMKILAKDITPKQAAANVAENLENPDDTPKHIGIGDTKEITKIICLEDVVMTRKLPNELQKASGDKGVYIINEHKVTLTKENGKPTLQRGITVMEGSKVILWTNSEKVDIEDGNLKNIDGSALFE